MPAGGIVAPWATPNSHTSREPKAFVQILDDVDRFSDRGADQFVEQSARRSSLAGRETRSADRALRLHRIVAMMSRIARQNASSATTVRVPKMPPPWSRDRHHHVSEPIQGRTDDSLRRARIQVLAPMAGWLAKPHPV